MEYTTLDHIHWLNHRDYHDSIAREFNLPPYNKKSYGSTPVTPVTLQGTYEHTCIQCRETFTSSLSWSTMCYSCRSEKSKNELEEG